MDSDAIGWAVLLLAAFICGIAFGILIMAPKLRRQAVPEDAAQKASYFKQLIRSLQLFQGPSRAERKRRRIERENLKASIANYLEEIHRCDVEGDRHHRELFRQWYLRAVNRIAELDELEKQKR